VSQPQAPTSTARPTQAALPTPASYILPTPSAAPAPTIVPTPTPTATPIPTSSGQQIVVLQGQQFPIALLANVSAGYHWQSTFDTRALALQISTGGAEGVEDFTFTALRVGTTSITFDYVSSTGAVTQSISYAVVVR